MSMLSIELLAYIFPDGCLGRGLTNATSTTKEALFTRFPITWSQPILDIEVVKNEISLQHLNFMLGDVPQSKRPEPA
jgi:hypothetical protein